MSRQAARVILSFVFLHDNINKSGYYGHELEVVVLD